MEKYLRFMKQALEGEEKKESQHDMAIFKKCRELCKKYDIHYNGKDFVPGDTELADSVFKAALELLDLVGIYCTTTGRTIKLSEEEIEKSLQTSKTLEIGRMREKVLVPIRAPMDKRPPVIIGGPMGGAVSEVNFLAVHLSAAREPTVQGIYAGAIQTLGGDFITVKSPLEMIASLKEARTERLACKLAGREGLALMGPGTPTISQAYMVVSCDELFSPSDPQEVYQLDELKTDYEQFYKIIFHQAHGNHYLSGQCPVFGGPSIGYAEGLAIVDTAETIQSKALTGSSFHASGAVHANTNSSSAREILWASNLSSLAVCRNMNYHTARYYWNLAGCCTDMMFYETAAQAIGDTVSGRDLLIGPVGGRGEAVDHSSGLESRFMGEIARMAAELDFEKADEAVGKIYEKYAERFAEPPGGKPFNECHTVTSEYEAEPTGEYLDLFHDIFAEIKRYFR